MLFSRERSIIFINREKICWAKMQVPSGKLLGVVQEVACSKENLQAALSDIAKNFPKKARIVVGEEFSYVTRFQKTKEQIQAITEAQALIPENLEEGWDSKDGDADNVQVMAVQKQVFAILKEALLENKIEAEAIEAESVSLIRLIFSEKDKNILIVCHNGKILLEVMRNGLILATKIFFQYPSKEQIQEFLDYVTNQKNITLDMVYVQDDTGELTEIFQEIGINVQEKILDPMVGIGQKKDIDGPDEEVLNIILGEKTKKIKEIFEKKTVVLANFREKILLVVFIAVLLGGIAVSYYIYKARI